MTSEEKSKRWLNNRVHSTKGMYISPLDLSDLLDEHSVDAKADQRELCAIAVLAKLRSIGFQIYDKGEDAIRDACLNATGDTEE